jgi:hypothetical protein
MLTFTVMLLFTLSHVLMKTVASSLIICVHENWLAIYMGCDMLLFLSLKLIRRDFTFWAPLPPSTSVFASLINRISIKVLTDFTLNLHMRSSMEIGGILFTLLVVQNQASAFVAGWVYLKYYDGGGTIEADKLWMALFSLLGLFLVSVLAFVLLMDRRYLGTFVSTTTGPQFAADKFHAATTDEQRLTTFKYHHYYYAAIEDELKALLAENWEDWMANRPEWLTEGIIATIDDKFLPAAEVEKLNRMSTGGKRRRSSFSLVEKRGKA